MEPLGFLLGAGAIYKFLQNRKKMPAPVIAASSAIAPGAAAAAGSPGVDTINEFLFSPGAPSYGNAGGAQTACRSCATAALPTNPAAPAPVAPVRAPLPVAPRPVAPVLQFGSSGFAISGGIRQPQAYASYY